jgi:hypothetical protein
MKDDKRPQIAKKSQAVASFGASLGVGVRPLGKKIKVKAPVNGPPLKRRPPSAKRDEQ